MVYTNGATRELVAGNSRQAVSELQFKQSTARETSSDHSSSGSNRRRMEADQQDAADSTGGQSDGYSWEFSSDGRFDATENWRRIQSARIRNETAEEAEDQRTEPMSVARDMIAAQEDGGKAALRAAQILEERFLLWDRAEQDRRRHG